MLDFFPHNLYDKTINSSSQYFYYIEIINKYIYKPFFFSNKYETSFNEIDSFLTIGLTFRQLFTFTYAKFC